MHRVTIDDLQAKVRRLNMVVFGMRLDSTASGIEHNPSREDFFIQSADARVGGYWLTEKSGNAGDHRNVFHGRTACELFNLMDAFERGFELGARREKA